MSRWIRTALVLVMLTPLTVTSTPPSLGPWHAFVLSGTLASSTQSTVEHYTVVAMGKFDGSWKMINSCPVAAAEEWGGAQDIVLTGASGNFYLSIWCCTPPESIAAAVVLPAGIIRGGQFARGGLEHTTYTASSVTTEDGFFCDHHEKHDFIDGYRYDPIEHLIVTVP